MKKTVIFSLSALFAITLSLSACSRTAGKDDIRSLQAAVDELRLSNYALEQRVTELENRANATPEPTATPNFDRYATPAPSATPIPGYLVSADELCSAFVKDGLASSFTRYTAESDPDKLLGTPTGYSSRSDFKDGTVSGVRGILEVYPYGSLAIARSDDLNAEIADGKRNPEIIYRYDNVILRLPSPFTPERSLQYEEALRRALGLVS